VDLQEAKVLLLLLLKYVAEAEVESVSVVNCLIVYVLLSLTEQVKLGSWAKHQTLLRVVQEEEGVVVMKLYWKKAWVMLGQE
jgi:hypothetical protein